MSTSPPPSSNARAAQFEGGAQPIDPQHIDTVASMLWRLDYERWFGAPPTIAWSSFSEESKERWRKVAREVYGLILQLEAGEK